MTPSDAEALQNHPLWTAGADGLLLVSADGTIDAANPTFLHMFGFDAGELVGRNVDVLVPDDAQDAHVHQRARYGQDPALDRWGPAGSSKAGVRTGRRSR